jgi:hypothetical protein
VCLEFFDCLRASGVDCFLFHDLPEAFSTTKPGAVQSDGDILPWGAQEPESVVGVGSRLATPDHAASLPIVQRDCGIDLFLSVLVIKVGWMGGQIKNRFH